MNSAFPAGKPVRDPERFASFLSVGGMFAVFVLLLVVLYPEREILDRMGKMPRWSPVSMHYLQALTRLRPHDLSLQISYAEVLTASGRYTGAIAVLDSIMNRLPASGRRHPLELRLAALKGILDQTPAGDPKRGSLEAEFAATALQLADGSSSLQALRSYLRQAKFAGAAEALSFLEGKDITEPGRTDPVMEESFAGNESDLSADNDPRATARRILAEMSSSADLSTRRRLFMQGIGLLQSANLPDEALAVAESSIDGLSEDRETLLFVTRLALAANRPQVAQKYVKRALRMDYPLSGRGEK